MTDNDAPTAHRHTIRRRLPAGLRAPSRTATALVAAGAVAGSLLTLGAVALTSHDARPSTLAAARDTASSTQHWAGKAPKGAPNAPGASPTAAAPQGAGGPPAAPLNRSAPQSISIPAIGVTSSLITLGLNADNSLQVPDSYYVAGWYTGLAAPGEVGPAVIVGHVDSKAGPGVFARLKDMQVGQQIDVLRGDGRIASFVVDAVRTFPKTAFPTGLVYGQVPDAELRVITCGGSFNDGTGHYRDNVVVFAHLVGTR